MGSSISLRYTDPVSTLIHKREFFEWTENMYSRRRYEKRVGIIVMDNYDDVGCDVRDVIERGYELPALPNRDDV